MQGFSWPVVSCIWTDYSNLQSKSCYSVEIREDADQKKSLFEESSLSVLLCEITFEIEINPSILNPCEFCSFLIMEGDECSLQSFIRKVKCPRIDNLNRRQLSFRGHTMLIWCLIKIYKCEEFNLLCRYYYSICYFIKFTQVILTFLFNIVSFLHSHTSFLRKFPFWFPWKHQIFH